MKDIPSTHFETIVLGELPIEESFEYYINELDDLERRCGAFPSDLFDRDLNSFKEKVSAITGGRMWFISCYIAQVNRSKKRIDVPRDFEPVRSGVGILRRKLSRSKDYSRDEFKNVLFQLTSSKNGFIDHSPLLDLLGEDKVSTLIRDNVLHYRPSSDFARDLIPFPEDDVVTATSQPALHAMRYLLETL